MKFPKEYSTIFLILFLLAFGIGHFVLGSICPWSRLCAPLWLPSSIFSASSTNPCTRQPPRFGEAFFIGCIGYYKCLVKNTRSSPSL